MDELKCIVCGTTEDELHLLRHMAVQIDGHVTLLVVCTGECERKLAKANGIKKVEELRAL